jgi:hypothetical protein
MGPADGARSRGVIAAVAGLPSPAPYCPRDQPSVLYRTRRVGGSGIRVDVAALYAS